MEQCLIDNKVCPIQGETQEEREEKWKRKLINVQLSEQCQDCSFLEVINLDEQIVRCPYLVKNKCLIK